MNSPGTDVVRIFRGHGKGRVLFHTSEGMDVFTHAPGAGKTRHRGSAGNPALWIYL